MENNNTMKATSIVRGLDSLGRIVIPIELRRNLDINEKDSIEIFTEGNDIILRKFKRGCIFCGDAREVINYKGKNICKCCLKELKK